MHATRELLRSLEHGTRAQEFSQEFSSVLAAFVTGRTG